MSKSRDKKYKEYRANQSEVKSAHMKAESAQTVDIIYNKPFNRTHSKAFADYCKAYEKKDRHGHYILATCHDYSHRDYTKGSSYVHDSWQESNDLYYSNKSDFPKDECPMNRKIDPNTKFLK